MTIVFRVDSSSRIGDGHVMRSIELAIKMKKKNVIFFSSKLGLKHKKILKKNKIKLISEFNIPDTKNHFLEWSIFRQKKDFNFLQKKLRGQKIKQIIIDHYGLSYFWEKQAKTIAKKVIVIDDLANKEHYCDFYINYHNHFKKNKINQLMVNKNTKLLLGDRFCLVGNIISSIKKTNFKNKISIYFGSVDKKNITLEVCKTIKNNIFKPFRFNIIIGKKNSNRLRIKDFIKKSRNIVCKEANIDNFSNYYKNIDNVISASGVTMYEQLSYGFKPIVIPQNENQKKIAKSLFKNELINLMDLKSIKNKKLLYKILFRNKNFYEKSSVNKILENIRNGLKNTVNQLK
tara:strand:+ start:414 stop:1448 length:1035 start_codon:yes stop_codon:yes gene_type:complete